MYGYAAVQMNESKIGWNESSIPFKHGQQMKLQALLLFLHDGDSVVVGLIEMF
jgi:hypothetical protein